MILTTTSTIDGYRVVDFCGIATGETVLGTNILKEIMANFTDVVGGRSGTYEKQFRDARKVALESLVKQAQEAGANAVMGIDIDYEVLGKENGMLMVAASGTAVRVERLP